MVEISTPPGEKGVKFDQLTRTRPVSGSASMNSLSAASRGLPVPLTAPCGLLTGPMTKGPCQVWPQSVERWTPMVCTVRPGAGVLEYLAMTIEA